MNGPLRHAAQERLPCICMENPEIPGRIQMERFIPVETFGEKSNTFRGITFFPFLSRRSKFSVPFVWITSARLHVQRKGKLYRYFVNGTTQSRSCFRCQKNTSTIWRKFSTEIFVQMVSAPDHQCEIASCDVRSTCSPVISLHLSYISYR